MIKERLLKISTGLLDGETLSLTPEEALEMVSDPGEHLPVVLLCSDLIRRRHKQNRVFLCSITNAKSGKCSQDCAFCAQSSFHDTRIETYPLMPETDLIDRAVSMEKTGATHYSIVTSGHSLNDSEIDRICRAVEAIRKRTGLTVCGSLGMLSEQSAKRLMASGMSRYHHNLETARSHFNAICTTHSYDEDIDTIRTAHGQGFQVCSGGIFGLGETWAQRVELAFTVKDLPVDTIPVNFLNPVPGTRLSHLPLVQPLDALMCIALMRLVNPSKSITICGGREVTLKDFQSWIFNAGANGLMIGNYLTTSGRDMAMDLTMVNDAGLSVEG